MKTDLQTNSDLRSEVLNVAYRCSTAAYQLADRGFPRQAEAILALAPFLPLSLSLTWLLMQAECHALIDIDDRWMHDE